LGDVFSFLSGLYFRGKLAYASAFGQRAASDEASSDAHSDASGGARSGSHTFVITTDRGLVAPDTRVRRRDLVAFAGIDIAKGGSRFRNPLRRDAERLAGAIGANGSVVLLGSIATGKYVDALTEILGERLLFPSDFVGRGDMSRGGLLLRRVREERELEYIPVVGAVRHGTRPAKLERIR
jgi:hypothetical protein